MDYQTATITPAEQVGPGAEDGLRCQLAELMFRLAGVCDAVSASYGVDVDYADPLCHGEAEHAYLLVAGHVAGVAPLPEPAADLAQRAAVLMRRLDGSWFGDGCLYACAVPAEIDLCTDAPQGPGEVPLRCSWASLEAVGTALGVHLR